jgi:hypothetical protein
VSFLEDEESVKQVFTQVLLHSLNSSIPPKPQTHLHPDTAYQKEKRANPKNLQTKLFDFGYWRDNGKKKSSLTLFSSDQLGL